MVSLQHCTLLGNLISQIFFNCSNKCTFVYAFLDSNNSELALGLFLNCCLYISINVLTQKFSFPSSNEVKMFMQKEF